MRLNNPLHSLQGYQLRRLGAALNALLAERLEELELRISEASLLVVLNENPGASQAQMGRVLGVVSSNMAPMVEKMEKRGYVQRQQSNGRKQALSLTKRGRNVAERAYSIMKAHEDSWLKILPNRQRRKTFSEELRIISSATLKDF